MIKKARSGVLLALAAAVIVAGASGCSKPKYALVGIWQEVKEITVEPDGTTTENPIEDGSIFEFEKGGRLKITSKHTIYNPFDPNTPSKTEVITTVSRWSTNGDWVMIGGKVVDIEVKGKTATLFSKSYDGEENRTIFNKIK